MVYEVDSLKCPAQTAEAASTRRRPDCGATMKMVALIVREWQPQVVEKILRHCKLSITPEHCEGGWREPRQRAPPSEPHCPPESAVRELTYDAGYFVTSFSNVW